ncbi:MAG: tetratricopeptide repeat protein, partial [Balneolaceae bacterium]|nr:tetratricopeptide repeat protein [Balneolaceae bacterium]
MKLMTQKISKFTCSGLCLFFLFLISMEANAQNFEDGLSLYEEAQYSKAAAVFNRLDNPEARLFSGKSYFSLGQYVKAKQYLSEVPNNAPKDIYLEAMYTSSLCDFQLGHYDKALTKLLRFEQEPVKTQLVTNALQLYDEILNFLTLNQRKEAYQSVASGRIKFDLVKTALGKVNYSTARLLIREYRETTHKDSLSSGVEELESMVSDSLNYAMQIAFGRQLEAPEGITYNIGAALPEYNTGDREFEISQGLYFGYLLAAEEF